MKWEFLNTLENTGRFNMDYDMRLAENCEPGRAFFRIYRWKPYCISLGMNQDESSVNKDKSGQDGIDMVKRPTGGRAILHSEEMTYSVVYPIDGNTSAKELYREINIALMTGLKIYDPRLSKIELEGVQPDFRNFYKEAKSAICFAVPAKSELKYEGKKLVGSAQRKMNNVLLQHGSILCGGHHKKIVDYLFLNEKDKKEFSEEMNSKTIDLGSILNSSIDYEKLGNCLKAGFEDHFKINFEENHPAAESKFQ